MRLRHRARRPNVCESWRSMKFQLFRWIRIRTYRHITHDIHDNLMHNNHNNKNNRNPSLCVPLPPWFATSPAPLSISAIFDYNMYESCGVLIAVLRFNDIVIVTRIQWIVHINILMLYGCLCLTQPTIHATHSVSLVECEINLFSVLRCIRYAFNKFRSS